jgi:hypothetical protein
MTHDFSEIGQTAARPGLDGIRQRLKSQRGAEIHEVPVFIDLVEPKRLKIHYGKGVCPRAVHGCPTADRDGVRLGPGKQGERLCKPGGTMIFNDHSVNSLGNRPC